MSSHLDFAKQAPGADGVDPQHPAAAHLDILDRSDAVVSLGGRKKIALCGFASSSRYLIPSEDPAWVIVGLNQLYRHMPRADVWFDIHLNWREDNVEGTDHPAWLKDCGIPVYMSDPPAELPTALRFPVERLIAKHGIDYFTSTVSFMVAWAIDSIDRAVAAGDGVHEDYTLGIFGIDLIVGTEYEVQKACVEFWLGIAEGKGIKLFLPKETALCKQQYRYGYEKEPNTGLVRLTELRQRHAELEATKNRLLPQMHALNGSIQLMRDLKEQLGIKGTAAEQVIERGLADAQPKLERAIAELQTYDGAQQENAHLVTVMELRLRGGQVPLVQAA